MALVCANALGSRPGFYEGEVLFLLSDPWVRRCRTHFNCTNRPGLCIRLRLSEKKMGSQVPPLLHVKMRRAMRSHIPAGRKLSRNVQIRLVPLQTFIGVFNRTNETTNGRVYVCVCVVCVCVLIPGCESGHIYNATQYATKMEKKSCLASAARPRIIIIISHQQNAESLQLKKAHSCTYPKSALV